MIRLGINGGWWPGPRPALPAGLWVRGESGDLLWEMAPDSPTWGEGASCPQLQSCHSHILPEAARVQVQVCKKREAWTSEEDRLVAGTKSQERAI